MPDATTTLWIRNASDERAVANGCRFDESRGQFVVDWAKEYLRLYEGDRFAGLPLVMSDWQYEVTMRLFGWVRWSDRLGREVRRFKRASIWTPKKCGKSPTLAAWGLYLLCADGEMGQKVYLAAKDGQQSREIAGKHALEMLLTSPELMNECRINRNMMQITHEPTKSILKPISSNDAKAQKAKEGLNGCVLVDETHVVDRAFMQRVSRAGISRDEPLQIEVSTAGNDPESYGKEQYDYGKLVESGEHEDQEHLFVSYEAPQDLEDTELANDPLKYGKMANPAWNRIIDPDELLADYQRSSRSVVELADFKMYRLNIWQQSANPWLNMLHWEACGEQYGEADMEGLECYGGLDLAKTQDTTALVLVFPLGNQEYRQLAYFWLPRDRAEEFKRLVPYLEWERQDAIVLTEGSVCDYRFVRKQINDIRQRFNLRKLLFDDRYAEEMMQALVEEDGMDPDVPEKFKQSMDDFAGPTAAYERLILDHKLHHNRNAVLNWQARNVTAKTDANENKRPVKTNDHKKIDGIVAGIMGLGGAMKYEGQSEAQLIIL